MTSIPGRAARRAWIVIAAAGCLALAMSGASASDTEWWIANDPSDYTDAVALGAVVGAEGVIGLGPAADVFAGDSLSTVWSIARFADGSLAVAGDGGRIDRWTAGGGLHAWVTLPVGQVFALAADGDGVVVGTGPDGLVYRVGAHGDTTRVARTGERYVWGIVPAGRGAWWAATGTRGRLLKLSGGQAHSVLDTEESNLVSLISDGAGGVYFGGDSKGRVVHVTADGQARTIFEASEMEIRGLALGPDGAVYAAALTGKAVAPAAESDDSGSQNQPTPVRGAVTSGKATVYRIDPDGGAVPWWSSPQALIYALAPVGDGIAAATGSKAGVYVIQGEGAAMQELSAPQGQVTALAIGKDGALFAGTSNPGALWRLGPGRARRGTLTSDVLDAGTVARFGRMMWHGEEGGSRIRLEARSGNTDPPDTTWSRWNGGNADAEGIRADVPAGRYLQWRLTLEGGNPRLESIEVARRGINLPPRITDLRVGPQGRDFQEGGMTPRAEPVTQNLPGGVRVEYSVGSKSDGDAVHGLPAWARGLRSVQWKGADPNGDDLTYRAEVRADGAASWIEIGKDLTTTAFTWDASSMPDGRYRVRITASDSTANALGEGRATTAVSEPFTVDNTPPEVTALQARADGPDIVFEATASDAMGPLSSVEVFLDDGDPQSVAPDDGILDGRRANVHGRLRNVGAGEHSVSVRAVDYSGNTARRAVRVTVR